MKNKKTVRIAALVAVAAFAVIAVAGKLYLDSARYQNAVPANQAQGEGGGQTSKSASDAKVSAADAAALEIDALDAQALAAAGHPVIVDISSESCGPCRAMKPGLVKAAKDLADSATVRILDVGVHPAAARDLPVRVTPTQFFITAQGTPWKAPADIAKRYQLLEVQDKATGQLAFTMHEGVLSYDDIVALAKAMKG